MSSHEDFFRQAQIAFQGKLVASAAHEFQNHFAVIKEYSGLIGDLLKARGGDADRAVSRCVELSQNITERADRASEAMEMLSRFAHRSDEQTTSFRVNEAVEELVALLKRSASQNKISLQAGSARRGCEVVNGPSLTQFALYLLIAPLLDALQADGKISVFTTRASEGSARVEIVAQGNFVSPMPDLTASESLRSCLGKIRGSVSVQPLKKSRQEIILTIPSLTDDKSIGSPV